MFQFGRCRSRYAIAASLLVTLVIDRTYCSTATNNRKGTVDVFDLLLGLYKLNPLKGSKVYTKFANNVLTHNDKKRSFNVKLSSNENGNKVTLQQLTDIETVLHPLYKKQMKHSMEQPEFDIENIDPETFNIEVILQDDLGNYKSVDKPSTKNVIDGIDISGLENILPNFEEHTKLVPAQPWLLPTNIKHNPAPVRESFPEYEEHRYGEQQSQVPNKVQEPTIIRNNELTPDVEVI